MDIIDQTAKVVMLKGEGGDTIKSIDKTTTQGLVDIYTITLESGNKQTFNVNNGNGIKAIEKTSTSGLVDTYTVTFDNGETTTFNVTNGEKGEKGDKGDTGPQGPQGPKGEKGDPGDGGGIVDTELSTTSTNPVQNKAVAEGINSIQSQIVPTASIEIGATASKAYSEGDFLVKDGILYKVTKAIAKDDVLTVGTNIVMTTVGGELSSARSNLFPIKEVLHVASTKTTATDYTTEPLDDYNFFIVSCGVLGFRESGFLYKSNATGFYSKAELLDTSNYTNGIQLVIYETDGAQTTRKVYFKYVNNTTIKLWYAGAYSFEVRIYGIKA